MNKYFVHTGDRYFYQPRFCFVLIVLGLWVFLKNKIDGTIIPKIFKISFLIIFILYSAASWIAVQKRIQWWISAGESSRIFLSAFQSQFHNVEDNRLFVIRNIPRWADSAPNKLIVLITGAAHALRLFYEKDNIDVIPYWDNDFETDMANVMKNTKNDYKIIFLDYSGGKFSDWRPPDDFIECIKKNNPELYDFNFGVLNK